MPFKVGDVVQVNYLNKDKWFPATIRAVNFINKADKTYDYGVEYLDTKNKVYGVNGGTVREQEVQQTRKRKAPADENHNSQPKKKAKKGKTTSKKKKKKAKAKPKKTFTTTARGKATEEELKINKKISKHLNQIAQEESGFKRSAVMKGARIVALLSHPLESGENFQAHKGIGKGIAAYIQEFFDEDLAADISSDEDNDNMGDLTKRFKPTAAQKKLVKEVHQQVVEKKWNNNKLKEMLGWNDQRKAGNKADMIQRIAECKVYGCLPKCPKCSAVNIKLKDDNSGLYYCKGYFDDDQWTPCEYLTGEVERPKWDDECEED